MKKYDEATAKRMISKKKSVNVKGNLIEVNKDNTDCGKGTWGKIDYLCHYCGYRVMFVNTINSSKKYNKVFDDEYDYTSSKTSKREQKLNISKIAKSKIYAAN